MTRGLIINLSRFSTHDGPGIRTTVFLKGCPLHCLWCHNPESQSTKRELMIRPNLCIACETCAAVCPEDAVQVVDGVILTDRDRCTLCGDCAEACYADAREMVGREVTAAEVLAEIEKDRVFYEQSGGGATFSGGEPLMQFDFLAELLRGCKDRGIHTTLDTSGCAPWSSLEAVRSDVDLFLFDLKAMDDALHRRVTGVSNRLIHENLRRLSAMGHEILVRVPLVPGINDTPAELEALSAFLASLPRTPAVELLPYHQTGMEKYRRLGRVYPLDSTLPPTPQMVNSALLRLRARGLAVTSGD